MKFPYFSHPCSEGTRNSKLELKIVIKKYRWNRRREREAKLELRIVMKNIDEIEEREAMLVTWWKILKSEDAMNGEDEGVEGILAFVLFNLRVQ